MKIRAYQPSDEVAVIALWSQCGLVSPESDPQADIRRKLSVQPELFVVGILDSMVIASAMAGYDGHRAYLYYLAVAPEHQRQGFGRAIVAHIQNLLRERGSPKLNLFVAPDNSGAFTFYERLGFGRNEMVCLGQVLSRT